MHIETEKKAIRQELQALHKLTADNGAFFHPSLKVVEKGGELSLASDLPAQSRDRLIAIPECCLPSIEDYDFSVCDGRILFKQKSGVEPSSLKTKLLEHQINIFNESEKLRQHCQSSFWFNLSDHPELQDHIIEGRADAPKIKRYLNHRANHREQELLIESFLGTRTFGWKENGHNTSQVLMPFLDYANHHPSAHAFQTVRPGETTSRFLAIYNSKIKQDCSQTYAFYMLCDSLDTFLIYNFFDNETQLVRSIPLKINLDCNLSIVIQSRMGGKNKQNLPKHLKDLQNIMPPFNFYRRTIKLGYLFIPGSPSIYSLRRILRIIIQSSQKNISSYELKKNILFAEYQIIKKNMKFYETLINKIINTKNINSERVNINIVKNISKFQLYKLNMYKNNFYL